MRRKAVLIGNTNGLAGVNVDISRFTQFLKSDIGGAWYNTEIDVFLNERKSNLEKKLDTLKNQSFDYLIVLFSGHGGQERETILEINGYGETIKETDLRKMANRQLNIYDCCRSYPEISQEAAVMDSLNFSLKASMNYVRQKYEQRIMQAIPQQALLYACSIGECSSDTPNGGVYLSNFLNAASNLNSQNEFKLVGMAHEEAKLATTQYCLREKINKQTPEAILPKCLSSQQLIISMNNNILRSRMLF